MLNIQPPSKRPTSPHPLFNLSFRIFFSAAALFACITMLQWGFIFRGDLSFEAQAINPFYWHAHEMFYGYAMAVIAGFLLTAVKTWTGMTMPYGYRLMGIFGCWASARMCWVLVGFGVDHTMLWIIIAGIADVLFMAWTAWAIICAVFAVKQYKQMGIISKLVLLTLGNILCYWGIYSGHMDIMRIGIYVGLYLVIGIVLTIGRRVVPFFIERGINYEIEEEADKVTVKNNKWLDLLSLLSFFIFMIADIFLANKILITLSASSVALVNIVRLVGWYDARIWQKPLLWSLYMAFIGMCLSFVLFALQPWLGFNHSIAVHALALSGVGMMTMAMMTRVALGHTGRSIHQPPKLVMAMFALMVLAFVCRVIMPLLVIEHYTLWLMLAQSAWIGCFVLFCVSYLPILSAPRTDKLFG